MASEPEIPEETPESAARIPRPVPGGSEHIESLGRIVDDLFGDARMRRRVQPELDALYLPEDEMPADPAPSEPPPPVPGGTEEITRGGRPDIVTK